MKTSVNRVILGTRLKKDKEEQLTLRSQYEDVAFPLYTALAKDPAEREEESVKDALEWWLQQLPASGSVLAPELRAPGDGLFQAFKRGRITTLPKGARLQDEGAEVRHYTVVLFGRCRLRCRAPASKLSNGLASPVGASGTNKLKAAGLRLAGKPEEEDEDENTAGNPPSAEGECFMTCHVIGRGEPIGLVPGETRSSYDVQCTERSVLLLLSAEDYTRSLRPFHQDLLDQTFEFLQQRNVLPQATPLQLRRVAAACRLRTVRRGNVFIHAGERQRHVWLLRSGACSILASEEEAQSLLAEEEVSSGDDGERADARFQKMREASRGGRQQQAKAAEAEVNQSISKYARGNFKRVLQGQRRGGAALAGPLPVGGSVQGAGFVCTAFLREPGLILGEEVLLFENFRDMVSQSFYYTVQAVEECSFYVLDVTAFRQLAMYIVPESIAASIEQKLNRRLEHISAGQKASKELRCEARELQKSEMQKRDRQKLRLPPSTGYQGIQELKDVNDWLRVVFEHRKVPADEKNPQTLKCLEGIGMNPGTTSGPGINAMLKAFADNGSLKEYRRSEQWTRSRMIGGRSQQRSDNPMGESIAPEANYSEAMPPSEWQSRMEVAEEAPPPLALGDGPAAAAAAEEEGAAAPQRREASPPSRSGGIFFQTEPELEGGTEPTLPAKSPAPRSPPSSPSRAKQLAAAGSPSVPSRSSSVPTLPRVSAASRSEQMLGSGSQGALARVDPAPSKETKMAPGHPHLMKVFQKVVTGKSLIVFTEQRDLRRGIMQSCLSAATEVSLCFVKSSVELWKRFNEAKEQHHALLLDLSKSELQVEKLLQAVRAHQRYSKIPIIVLSAERELPEVVRVSCSFVVFLPLAASMLREALLWVFDRPASQVYYKYDLSYATPNSSVMEPSSAAPPHGGPAPPGGRRTPQKEPPGNQLRIRAVSLGTLSTSLDVVAVR